MLITAGFVVNVVAVSFVVSMANIQKKKKQEKLFMKNTSCEAAISLLKML